MDAGHGVYIGNAVDKEHCVIKLHSLDIAIGVDLWSCYVENTN